MTLADALSTSSHHALALLAPALVALALDVLLGDPPNRWHPTAWMGSFIAWGRERAPQHGRAAPFLFGLLLVLCGATLAVLAGLLVHWAAIMLPAPWRWLALGAALKLTLSGRGLAEAANQVRVALVADDLPEARRLVAWHLCSRDMSRLDEPQTAAAAIESVAENLSDSLVAPLFFAIIGGLPAAFAYRFLNTADAMLGYRDAEREWLGKAPARLDDLANLIPARLAALALIVAAPFVGGSIFKAFGVWRRDALSTASPNAGCPMSAAAGALDIELEKVGVYQLNAGARPPQADDLARAVRLGTAALAVLMLGAASGLIALGVWKELT